MKRFLLDNDTGNIISTMGEDVEGAVEEAVRECPPNVTTYLLCSSAGSCYWPSKIGPVYPHKDLLAAHARGLDPLGMLLEGVKAAGKETFITYRMNDVHNPTDASQWNTPRIRREHPECIVGPEEVRQGRADWMSYCMDYSLDEVRRYVLDLIQEQISLYGHLIDGFQLDWMRFPRHLSGTPEQIWEKREVLTEFMAQVRAMVGGRILLGARVPTTPAGCRRLGVDLSAWACRELVDLLVVCPFLTTEWHVPIADFRALLGGRRIPVYAGFDFGFGQQLHFPESLRGICSCLYGDGADGIYVFNFPCWSEYMAATPYHWLCGLERPDTAAAKPLLLAVDHRRNRVPGVDQEARIPATMAPGRSLMVDLRVPSAALPAWRGLCLVHSHGDVTLDINGHPGREIGCDQRAACRSEIFVEFVDQHHNKSLKDARPKPEDCRIFSVDPAHLRAGANQITLVNVAAEDIEVKRVNLALW
jgi:hypothetical protein